MKLNSIVIFLNDGIVRLGVVIKRVSTEELHHSAIHCVVRLMPTKAEPRIHVEVFEPMLAEYLPTDEQFADPVHGIIRRSDDLESAQKYAAEKAAKPSEDPDEIPF